jgi:phage terminase large subunit-like protein
MRVAGIILKTNPRWRELAAETKRHTSVVAPPGSAKTTLIQSFYEWLIGRASLLWGEAWADMIHIGHVSASSDQASGVSFAVRDTVMGNEKYRLVFPKVLPHQDKFAEKEWRVKGCTGKDPTFRAVGVHGPLLGIRLNFLGMDDLIDEEMADSSTELESALRWVRRTALRRLVPGGCAWSNATRWTENDLAGWCERERWGTIVVKGLDENEESYWPDRFPTAELLAEREADPEAFSLQYMGEPAPEEGIDFKREWFLDRFDELPRQTDTLLTMQSWDTAGTRNARSDYTAGWTAVVTKSWDIYLTNLYHAKLEFDGVLDAIQGEYHFAKARIILIEDMATGQPAAQLLRKHQYGALPMYPMRPFGERGQPKLRDALNQIKPIMAEKRVHLPSDRRAANHGLAWVPTAEHQLFSYPRTQHDDIVRSLLQMLYFIVEMRTSGFLDTGERPEIRYGNPAEERRIGKNRRLWPRMPEPSRKLLV